MTAGIYNLIVEQGATFTRVITWRDSDGALVDLTNYTARMMAREKFEDASAIFELTTENGGIALGGAAGTITLTISATATAAFSAQVHGVYDLELVDSGGVVTRLLKGRCEFDREATY
jgi:hypothetical protein